MAWAPRSTLWYFGPYPASFSAEGRSTAGSVVVAWLPLKFSPTKKGTGPFLSLGMYISMVKENCSSLSRKTSTCLLVARPKKASGLSSTTLKCIPEGTPGSRPYICERKSSISSGLLFRTQSLLLRTFRPSSIRSGSGSVYGSTSDSSWLIGRSFSCAGSPGIAVITSNKAQAALSKGFLVDMVYLCYYHISVFVLNAAPDRGRTTGKVAPQPDTGCRQDTPVFSVLSLSVTRLSSGMAATRPRRYSLMSCHL